MRKDGPSATHDGRPRAPEGRDGSPGDPGGRGQGDGDGPVEGLLDDRKSKILRAVVTEYIETAQPVGSTHVARSRGIGVSPATVRNEMAVLEEEGYLAQPHTSAGRIPTDKGYRFFVDALPSTGRLVPPEMEEVSTFFARTHGELEQMLTDTCRLLSTMTHYAAVVVGPNHESAQFRSAQLVYLSANSVLAVVVLSDGAVEKHTLEVARSVTEASVDAASQVFAVHLRGRSRTDTGVPQSSGDDMVDGLVRMAVAAIGPADANVDPETIFVGGAARMADAFDAIETVRSVLAILEQQILVVNLLRSVLERDELTVAIGREHGVAPLAECSVVVAPYRFGSDEMGVVGVLGPTRMHYERAMSTVSVVGRELETRLADDAPPCAAGATRAG